MICYYLAMTKRKPRFIQEQLFPVNDVMGDHFILMKHFLNAELRGKRLDTNTEMAFITTFDILGIAASSLAQTLAKARGYVDPESVAFESENLVARMDPLNASGDDPFNFDINHDPKFELYDLTRINAAAIDLMTERALGMANVVVYEVEEENKLLNIAEH
jgi:hypothetical protein